MGVAIALVIVRNAVFGEASLLCGHPWGLNRGAILPNKAEKEGYEYQTKTN